MKHRSQTDIISQILDAATGGATKTKIMYKAFLSYAQVKTYLSMLLENGLLKHDKGEDEYKITEKGLKFMRIYQSTDNITGPRMER
jgi:predicted transcriptional regulator